MKLKNKAPLGVKVISILHYIGAAVLFSFVIWLFFFASRDIPYGTPFSVSLTIIILGSLVLGEVVLAFFLGRGLWKLQNWARIIAIIFGVISLVIFIRSLIKVISIRGFGSLFFGFASIPLFIFPLLVILIVLYLSFAPEVKKAFK